jgi:hypothetical protein
MLLSCRLIQNASSVNDFDYVERFELTEGDTPSVYLQLVDLTVDKDKDPPGRRYMPAAGAALQVTLDHLDDSKKIVRAATQPFAQDPSIWKFDILLTDVVKGTVTLRLQLTEGSKVTRGSLRAALCVQPSGV